MQGLAPPSVPEWVIPDADAIRECYRVSFDVMRRGLDSRDRGVVIALAWVLIGEQSPITGRRGDETSWEHARAESWVALCFAAGQAPPTERDWQRLGINPKPALTCDREFAYGVWRTLAWFLGVRGDWPLHTAWHQAAEIPRERPHVYLPKGQRDTDAWRAADQASRDQAQRDACRYWQHVRALADATGGA